MGIGGKGDWGKGRLGEREIVTYSGDEDGFDSSGHCTGVNLVYIVYHD